METWCHYVKSVTVCTHSKSIDIRLAEVWTYFLFGSFITNFDCLYWTNGFEILKSDDFRRRNVPCFNFWIQTHLKTGEFCFSPTCLHSGDPTASKIQIRFSPWLHIPERGTPSLPSLVLATKPRSCSGHCLKWENPGLAVATVSSERATQMLSVLFRSALSSGKCWCGKCEYCWGQADSLWHRADAPRLCSMSLYLESRHVIPLRVWCDHPLIDWLCYIGVVRMLFKVMP